MQQPFLEAYVRLQNITWAAKAVGISRSAAMRWKKYDRAFMEKFERAEYLSEKLTGLIQQECKKILSQNGKAIGQWSDGKCAAPSFDSKESDRKGGL